MVRYRTGRKVGNTLYLQLSDEPSDGDTFVGSCITPGHAANVARFATAGLTTAERLEALEEIRQRVVDGWAKYRQQYYGPPVYYWFRGNLTHREPMSPEVAALLWPEDTSG